MISHVSNNKEGISDIELSAIVQGFLKQQKNLKRVLLIPPDLTRMHSGAGRITQICYEFLKSTAHVDVLPALGTHDPMTEDECSLFFGSVPYGNIIKHNWRKDIVRIGEVPAEFVSEVSEGLISSPIDVEVNRLIIDKSYDLILSIGQVVPHEVAGMANHSKNIFVGCGGSSMINQSHMLGAVYGMERIMGRVDTPVRSVFDCAKKRFLGSAPIQYIMTVATQSEGKAVINGIFIGRERKAFEEAAALSQKKNITVVEKPLNKVVVYLDASEFRSMWLGNKSIYRTRMALKDGGELIVLAPGIRKFGEDANNDALIRKYGYRGRHNILELCKTSKELAGNSSVAAHLIHGSSDGRFSITYAVDKLTKQEIEDVGFKYMKYSDAVLKYNPQKLKEGFNSLENGEEVFYISNPALGLWSTKEALSK